MKNCLESVFSKEKAQLYFDVLKALKERKENAHYNHSQLKDRDSNEETKLKNAVVLLDCLCVSVDKSNEM